MQYGRYRIVKELGKGSMGVVYQAHDPQIDRLVALKVLRPDRVASEAFVHRFVKEAKAVGRLSHPNIVVVFDIGEDHGTVYLSMEYLEGSPLNEILKEQRLSIEQAVKIGIQVSDALDYAHRKGIVHRDIKPSNIIVQPDDAIKITDFGIARIEDPLATQQTQAGEILGTPAYMSPEQVLGQPVDGRSDLFSLGVILYELTAGQRPFSGESLLTIFRSITHDDPREPTALNPSLPKPLSKVILKALAKETQQRYATGSELGEALRGCLKQREPDMDLFGPSKVEGHRRSLPLPMLLVALIVSVGLAASAIFFLGVGRENSTTSSAPEIQPQLSGRDHRTDAPSSTYHGEPSSGHTPQEESASQPPAQPLAESTPAQPPPERTEPADTLSTLGSLKLDSKPTGAEVLIDGKYRGLTPLEVALPSGAHEVRLTLTDHGDWEAQVRVSQNRVTQIPVELMRIQ